MENGIWLVCQRVLVQRRNFIEWIAKYMKVGSVIRYIVILSFCLRLGLRATRMGT
jgi:hypothetical protein